MRNQPDNLAKLIAKPSHCRRNETRPRPGLHRTSTSSFFFSKTEVLVRRKTVSCRPIVKNQLWISYNLYYFIEETFKKNGFVGECVGL